MADVADCRMEYNEALAAERKAQKAYRRVAHLKMNPTEPRSDEDEKLLKHSPKSWKKRYKTKAAARKQAKKEYDDAQKSLEAFKEEDAKGFLRENDIQRNGSQYTSLWSNLPT